MEVIVKTSKKDIDLGVKKHEDSILEIRMFLESQGFELEHQEFKDIARFTWLEQTYVRPINYTTEKKAAKTSRRALEVMTLTMEKLVNGEISVEKAQEINSIFKQCLKLSDVEFIMGEMLDMIEDTEIRFRDAALSGKVLALWKIIMVEMFQGVPEWQVRQLLVILKEFPVLAKKVKDLAINLEILEDYGNEDLQ